MVAVELQPGIRIQVPEAPWSERERLAWYWPEPILPSEWGERYVIIDKSAVPGPFRNASAPYLRGIMDLAVKRGIVQLAVMKAVQLGVSLATRILTGFWAHMDPAPMGLALPNKEKGREIVENELMPFFKENFARHPELKGLFTGRLHDIKKGQIRLANAFLLHLMWSGSPASMASNPMKRALADEVNKFALWAGNDADPISLVRKRLRTYPDAILILVSSPTDSQGQISVAFDASTIKLYFLVPCPHCQTRQRLVFGSGADFGVKWSDKVRKLFKEGRRNEAAAAVLQTDADGHSECWYQCAACHKKITERQKRAMVLAGKWGTIGKDDILAASPGPGVITDAEALPEFPRGSWVGMHISALYAMWESCTLAHVAAEFLRASNMQQLFDFRTGTLGENWEQSTQRVDKDQLVEIAKDAPAAGALPRWTGRVIAAIDTQKDHFYVVIRAWGPGMRSRRIWHGKVASFEELEHWCRKTPWKNEDPRIPPRVCDLAFIDSGGTRHIDDAALAGIGGGAVGSRVMEVYAWVLKNQAWARAIKGDAHPRPGSFIRRGVGEYVSGRMKKNLPILLLDTHHFQDELADLMDQKQDVVDVATGEVTGEARAWELNDQPPPKDGAGDDYPHHLANMHKVSEGKGEKMAWKWRPVREGVRVDFRMCEVYSVAGAYVAGVHTMGDMTTYLEYLEAELAATDRRKQSPAPSGDGSGGGFTNPYGQAFVASRRR